MGNFINWLKNSRYIKSDTVAGDLANDILRDKDFPDTDDKEQLTQYITYKLAMNGHSQDVAEFKKIYKL